MSAVSVMDRDEKPRRELLLGMLQKEFPSYHPLMSIARIAHNEEADLKLQFECHKTIAKYVEPELKSIEVKGGAENRHRVSVSLFDPIEGEYAEVVQPEQGARNFPMAIGAPASPAADVDYTTVDRVVQNW